MRARLLSILGSHLEHLSTAAVFTKRRFTVGAKGQVLREGLRTSFSLFILCYLRCQTASPCQKKRILFAPFVVLVRASLRRVEFF